MNCSCYLFGRFDGRIVQYPADGTSTLFENAAKYCSRESQLVIHREGRLVYYIFLRKLQNTLPSYVGVSLVFAEVLVTNLHAIYTILENSIDGLAAGGVILDYSKKGMVSVVKGLSKKTPEVNFMFQGLVSSVKFLGGNLQRLPSDKYGVDKQSFFTYSLTQNCDSIIDKMSYYGYLIVYREATQNAEWNSIRNLLGNKEDSFLKIVSMKFYNFSTKDKAIVFMGIIIIILILIVIQK